MALAVSESVLGIVLASVAAVGFAGQFLCIRLGTDDGEVTDAVLVVLCCNVVLVTPPIFLVYSPPYTALFTPVSVVSFAAAGIAGMFVARLLMFESIKTIGASLTSPVIASNILFATVFAVVLLGERLTAVHLSGIVLIVAGIGLISWETAATTGPDRSVRETGTTLALPVAAAVCIGIEPVFISIGLAAGTTILPGVAVMAGSATIGFTGYLLWSGSLRRIPLQTTSTAWYIAGGISTTIAFLAYFGALEVAPVVLVMPLLQLTPLIVVVLSALFLPRRLEHVSWRIGAAAIVVVVGAAVVSVSG